MFEIENDELPKSVTLRPNRGRPPKYPFYKMEVGDNFVIETKERALSAIQCANSWGNKNNAKFARRKDGDVWRIWRMA